MEEREFDLIARVQQEMVTILQHHNSLVVRLRARVGCHVDRHPTTCPYQSPDPAIVYSPPGTYLCTDGRRAGERARQEPSCSSCFGKAHQRS